MRGYSNPWVTFSLANTRARIPTTARPCRASFRRRFLPVEAHRPGSGGLGPRGRVEDRAHLCLLFGQLLPRLGHLRRDRVLLVLRERKQRVELSVTLGGRRRHKWLGELFRLNLVEGIVRGEPTIFELVTSVEVFVAVAHCLEGSADSLAVRGSRRFALFSPRQVVRLALIRKRLAESNIRYTKTTLFARVGLDVRQCRVRVLLAPTARRIMIGLVLEFFPNGSIVVAFSTAARGVGGTAPAVSAT